ncbi:MAG TPA: HAD family hydrolase [Polyangiales bacterium]|nr:HAD family hydrolase [Polyangiales bacterium]
MTAVTHVLFDFFGTLVAYDKRVTGPGLEHSHRLLVDSGSSLSREHFEALWTATFERYEQQAHASFDEFALETACSELLRNALPRAFESDLVARFRDTFLAEWNEGVCDLPGVPALLSALRERFTLVLVSNTNHAPLVHGHLRRMAVAQHFHAVVTSVEHGRRKPSPCIFHHALELTSGRAEAAVYVGDSYAADYHGALAAGLRPLLIDPQHRHPIPDEHRIASILDLHHTLS